MKIAEIAENNFKTHIAQNSYPGRGLVIARSGEDSWLIIYWIMGRSVNSRNRRFAAHEGVLRTEPIDVSLVSDPSLVIYDAMLELPGIYLVSNGDQTRTIYDEIQRGGRFEDALAKREREPDAPNYTPRISAMLSFEEKTAAVLLSILKASPLDSSFTDRYFFQQVIPRIGYGFGLTTYTGDGDPLPSFVGDPLLLPCREKAEETLDQYWNGLNAENRIALGVKEIKDHGRWSRLIVKNRF